MDRGSRKPRRIVPLLVRGVVLLFITSSLRAALECPSFRRGDSNTDGSYDISDPVKTLMGLFLGVELDCEKAADADDSGVLDVSDVVFSLQYLFLQGKPPPPPGPKFCERAIVNPIAAINEYVFIW